MGSTSMPRVRPEAAFRAMSKVLDPSALPPLVNAQVAWLTHPRNSCRRPGFVRGHGGTPESRFSIALWECRPKIFVEPNVDDARFCRSHLEESATWDIVKGILPAVPIGLKICSTKLRDFQTESAAWPPSGCASGST